jgi:hypothetical protein
VLTEGESDEVEAMIDLLLVVIRAVFDFLIVGGVLFAVGWWLDDHRERKPRARKRPRNWPRLRRSPANRGGAQIIDLRAARALRDAGKAGQPAGGTECKRKSRHADTTHEN